MEQRIEINTSSKAKGAVRMHVFHSILKHLNAGILQYSRKSSQEWITRYVIQSAHWIK